MVNFKLRPLYPRENYPGSHWVGRSVCRGAGLLKRIIFCAGIRSLALPAQNLVLENMLFRFSEKKGKLTKNRIEYVRVL
jgi:hypothetical protein